MIQVGQAAPRVFMIGGGDFKTLPDSMFQCREVVPKTGSAKFNLQFIEMKKMRYARHGHSVCQIQDRYLIVSGSRKEVNSAATRVELYDTNNDDWMDLANLNEGRHYHSSCQFSNQYLFVFGGIQNQSKKYSATIERLYFEIGGKRTWETLNHKPQIGSVLSMLTARQGAGMCQVAADQLVIVGGFNGKFLTDGCVVTMNKDTCDPVSLHKESTGNLTLFPFQVPTIGSTADSSAISIDWQSMALYKFSNGRWEYVKHVKG